MTMFSSQWFASSGAVAAATFVSQTDDLVNATNYTFTNHAIGAANATRKVVVMVMSGGGSTGTISGVTLAGNSMTEIVGGTLWVENDVGMYQYDLSSGTTATIVVSHSGGKGYCSVGVWAVTDAEDSAHDTLSVTGDTTPNGTIDIPANGVLLCGCSASAGSNPTSVAWTGPTELSDSALSGENAVNTCAGDDHETVQSSYSVLATFSPSPGQANLVCASFGSG